MSYKPTPEEESKAKANEETHQAKTFEAIVDRVHDAVVKAAEKPPNQPKPSR